MTTAEFLLSLRDLGMKLWLEDGLLRFTAPKGVLTAKLHAEIATHKIEIIAFMQEAQTAKQQIQPPLVPVERGGILPLSFSQARLWFQEQLLPGNAAYHVPLTVRLAGPLQIALLDQSLQEIVRRHETLRTTFTVVDQEPVQIVAPVYPVSLPIVDLVHIPADCRILLARQLAKSEAHTAFDLVRGPLFRASVLRISVEEHILLFTMHHSISDGWSINILLHELSYLYNAYRVNQSALLPDLPIQYSDYALWQQKWLQGDVRERLQNYWRTQLQGAPAFLHLPSDQPRPAIQTTSGAEITFTLPATGVQALKALGQRASCTLFMTVLAIMAVFLARLSGLRDIVIGTPIAGRTQPETRDLIGFFVNTLVLRCNLQGNPTFRELLQRVREVTLSAYEHQDLPFEELVSLMRPPRHPGYTPLFQVIFQLESLQENIDALVENFSQDLGLHVLPFKNEHITAKFDFSVQIVENESGLLGNIIYNTDVFETAWVQHWSIALQTLLQSFALQPEQRIEDVELLSVVERREILVQWNATESIYPRDTCLHHLFEEEVQRSPDAVALVSAQTQLSYGELDQRATLLAQHLQKWGVGPEIGVGLCLERGVEMIVGVLATLKAGGVYVPLDPSAPQPRLLFLLQDAQVRIVLTQTTLSARFVAWPGQVLDLSAPDASWFVEHRSSPQTERAGCAEQGACVMYTSGSTGQPKGVLVSHRNIVRLVRGANYAHFGRDAVFLQFAPLAFDASTLEIWGALLHGSRLVMMPGGMPTLEQVGQLVQQEGVSTLWLTASLFHQMVEHHLDRLAGVHQLLAGGEALSVAHVQRFVQQVPGCALINGYGPTEATTFSCCQPITSLQTVGATVPIGRPISNAQVYVLDARMRPCPVGVAGELYIAGDGVARGYLRRPDWTAERFVPNPWSAEAGGRCYKTGDQVRWRADGAVEFLGRWDQQVKIRGYRIELEEIAGHLRAYPGVQDGVVILREDSPLEKRLVAYVVLEQTQILPISSLRRFLQERLPDYMLPAAFVLLQQLPLTANGKIDRQALPAPDSTRPALDETYVAPVTQIERAIVAIWQEVLQLENVGIHDNFFDVGGNSLLLVRVHAQLQGAFHKDIELIHFFKYPTVHFLALYLTQEVDRVPSQQDVEGRAQQHRKVLKKMKRTGFTRKGDEA